MSRLPRPNPTVEVRCRVVLRQLGEMFIDDVIEANEYRRRAAGGARSLGKLLAVKLADLATLLKCEVSDLRLDHTWALENRPKVFKKGVHVDYKPAANDPEWLGYRPHGTRFAGSHDVKTRIRGDHGQLSDNMIAKKNRNIAKRRARRAAGKATGFQKKPFQVKRTTESRAQVRPPKRKWASRPFPKGRSFNRRPS